MSKRILLVDDQHLNLKLLEAHLQSFGHELISCTSGAEALRSFAARRPDLVLLDIKMPGIDGIDVLRSIRSAGGEHTPVILVTAHAERDQRLRGLEAGADEFLEKPVDSAILIARVNTLLKLKEQADDLVARNEALERLQREQRELMNFIVHDLKNPIAVAWSNVDWVCDELPDRPRLLTALDDARDSLERLNVMVEDLLIVSRLEEDRFPVKAESVSIGELLDDIVRIYQKLADQKQVELARSEAEGVNARADRQLLRRVLENILDNALRYTPVHGKVGISARSTSGIELVVHNTGPIISTDDRRRIFDKFVRGGTDSGTGTRNAGLGLYFCRRAVEACGGDIDVVEEPDWPTSFMVRLPQADN